MEKARSKVNVTFNLQKRTLLKNSLAVQRLALRTFTAEGQGSMPGRGTKIPQAAVRPKK